MLRSATIIAALLALGLFLFRTSNAANGMSQTFDEGVHIAAGISYWRTGDFRLNAETPPIAKLILTVFIQNDVAFEPDADAWERGDQWTISDRLLYDSGRNKDEKRARFFSLLVGARRVSHVFGVCLVALIGWWAGRLWGELAGVLACWLAALDPNLIAFSAIAGTDIALALFATATAYCLWEYSHEARRSWFIAAGVCLGLALGTKFSAVISVAGLVAGASTLLLAGGRFGPTNSASRIGPAVTAFVRLGFIAAGVVILGYGIIHALDWPRGLKQQLVRGQFGDPKFFLNGEISSTGWWSYFPIVLGIKTPAGTLVLAVASLLFAWRGVRFDRRSVAFLIVPAAVYLFAMAASKIDIGWRVILPMYPALIVFAARSITLISARWLQAIIFVGALTPSLLDWRYLGREISYANGLVVCRTDLHKHFGDSNIDWGQGLMDLGGVLRERGYPVIFLSYAGTAHPEVYHIKYERLPGWGQLHAAPGDRVDRTGKILVAVSVSNLQGTYLDDPTRYRWLLEREPISRTDGSIWLFDLTGDDEAIRRIEAMRRE